MHFPTAPKILFAPPSRGVWFGVHETHSCGPFRERGIVDGFRKCPRAAGARWLPGAGVASVVHRKEGLEPLPGALARGGCVRSLLFGFRDSMSSVRKQAAYWLPVLGCSGAMGLLSLYFLRFPFQVAWLDGVERLTPRTIPSARAQPRGAAIMRALLVGAGRTRPCGTRAGGARLRGGVGAALIVHFYRGHLLGPWDRRREGLPTSLTCPARLTCF